MSPPNRLDVLEIIQDFGRHFEGGALAQCRVQHGCLPPERRIQWNAPLLKIRGGRTPLHRDPDLAGGALNRELAAIAGEKIRPVFEQVLGVAGHEIGADFAVNVVRHPAQDFVEKLNPILLPEISDGSIHRAVKIEMHRAGFAVSHTWA